MTVGPAHVPSADREESPPASVVLTVTFHGPFHVGGSTVAGLDRGLDRRALLPGSSVKGLLRAEASERLGFRRGLVEEVFGAPGARPGSWWFSDAEFDDPPQFDQQARIRRGADGVTERGFLMVGEVVWASSATVTIEPVGAVATRAHRLVLRAAARSVSALGGGRRRGSGWVSIEDHDPWEPADTRGVLALFDPPTRASEETS